MSWSESCGCVIASLAACQRHMMVQYCCGSGSTSRLFCTCFMLLQEANEVLLDVWLFLQMEYPFHKYPNSQWKNMHHKHSVCNAQTM